MNEGPSRPHNVRATERRHHGGKKNLIAGHRTSDIGEQDTSTELWTPIGLQIDDTGFDGGCGALPVVGPALRTS